MIFTLENKELKTFKKWNEEHKKTCPLLQSGDFRDSTGARLTFSFIPTGIGMCIQVKCGCGEIKDCTNVDKW